MYWLEILKSYVIYMLLLIKDNIMEYLNNFSSRRPYKLMVLSLLGLSISGCNSTRDLHPSDSYAPQLNVNLSKSISDRVSVSAHVNVAQGDDKEVFRHDNAIQIDEQRYVGTEESPLALEYKFDVAVSALLLDIHLVKTARYQLILSPGLSYVTYDLDIDVNNTDQFSTDEHSMGYGFQLQNIFTLTDDLSISLNVANFDTESKNIGNVSWLNTSLDYLLTDNLTLGLGYNVNVISDPTSGGDNRDLCTSDSAAEECENSEVTIDSSGFMLKVGYRF